MIRKKNQIHSLGQMFFPNSLEPPPKIRPDHIIKLFTPSLTSADQVRFSHVQNWSSSYDVRVGGVIF